MKQIVFFGTPQIAADVLEYVVSHSVELQVEVSLVVTTPDKPVGRKKVITPSPARVAAQTLGIPVRTGKIGDEVVRGALRRADHALLFAYGRIIPQDILDLPAHGFVNIHPSALPLYRGASPICFPLLLGDRELGVTLMQMDAQLDHGPIITQELVPTIYATRDIVEHELATLACRLYTKLQAASHERQAVSQSHEQATYTFQLTRDDGYVEWTTVQKLIRGEALSASELPVIVQKYISKNPTHKIDLHSLQWLTLQNLYYALTPWPGLWTRIVLKGEEKRIKIITVAASMVTHVQIEGKQPVDYSTFVRAYDLL